MKNFNIWSLLLAAIISALNNTIFPFLFGGPENYHVALGVGSSIATGFVAFMEIAMIALSNFDLRLAMAALLIRLAISGIKIAIKSWALIKTLIKLIPLFF